jgi:PAS domain S-box-containing protein
MKNKVQNKELFHLMLVLFIALLFAAFSVFIPFVGDAYNFLLSYSRLYYTGLPELLNRSIFLYLTCLLWITYRRWEGALKREKALADVISNISPDVILVVDWKRNILMCNTLVKKVFGYEVDEVVHHRADLLYIHGSGEEEHWQEMCKILKKVGIHTQLVTGKKKNGEAISLEIISGCLSDGNGAVLLLRDITERKKTEQEMIRAEKLRVLGELAGGVAHDFNNVLAAILGRTQLLKKSFAGTHDAPERDRSLHDLKKGLGLIEKAALDGAETVHRIQEFSRKRNELDESTYFTDVDPLELIHDALEFTKIKWKDEANSKGIKITIEQKLAPVPPVSGKASELREVLTNIINNAVDALPQGGTIRISTLSDGNTVSITVEDNGIGIPEEIRDRIFDPFFSTKGPRSTGLGMSVSYGIIDRHRGSIMVDSREEKGTTFTINLPAAEQREGRKEKKEAKPVMLQTKKATILVIDDEESVRDLLCDILVDGGHAVEFASSGSEGLELFKQKEFDLVFTDLGMPGMSGWQVAEEVKKIRGNTPIALITGWKVELEESEKMEKGIDFIVNKPFQMNQVLSLVQDGIAMKEKFVN